ncbi:MAG: RtcB family protein, partial [Pedobacter sp.]
MKTEITGKTLKALGYTEGKILGLALEILKDNFQDVEANEVQKLLKKVKNYPESFLDDEVLSVLATAILEEANPKGDGTIGLTENAKVY